MPPTQFLVDSVIAPNQIAGRNDKLDIPVGTVFTRVTKSCVAGDPMRLETVDVGDVASVTLKLVDVEHYQKRIDFVPGGHTAILFVDGEGVGDLAALLGTIEDGEYLWLVAEAI